MQNYIGVQSYHRERIAVLPWDGVSAGKYMALASALFITLSFLYVMERNAIMNVQRSLIQQEATLAATEKEAGHLEIQTVELVSHTALKAIAFEDSLIAAPAVRYVAVGEDAAVAFVR
ncbi:MAG: hypothetical protein AAB581_04165 [Patescibacteria group bacterium]|mgnify:CR=1 FL=1